MTHIVKIPDVQHRERIEDRERARLTAESYRNLGHKVLTFTLTKRRTVAQPPKIAP